ncbi:MAG: 1-acyl-sn-glycerol-3-phosphate acyltransferase [Bacteroidota bacterium]
MESPTLAFSEISPYEDDQVNEVLLKIAQKPSFLNMVQYMFPHLTGKEIQEGFKYIHSTRAFQALYIHQGIRSILGDSTNGLSYTGIKELDKQQAYLFLSNHRDIILDSACLNILLFEHGYDTTHIAIGDNLMVSKLVTSLMKLNKSFIVHRTPPRKQLLAYSERLSRYIQHVMQEGQSVWVAQRSGRTKDGFDQTHPGLLKMLALTFEEENWQESWRALNLTPMAISYEYEPCDGLKAEEMVHQELDLAYEKDDKRALITGIRQPKGRIHLAVGRPLKEEIDTIDLSQNKNQRLKQLAALMDQKIYELYKRWPTNYCAADMLRASAQYQDQYSAAEQGAFEAHLKKTLSKLQGPQEALRKKLLEIYAGPVLQWEISQEP